MSITDELREWARDNTVQGEVLTTYPVQHPVHGTLESLLAIADRIAMHDVENGYYQDRDTEFVINGKKYIAHEWGVTLNVYGLTPEQAIEATLGCGTCELSGYADAAFRVVQAVDQQDFIDYAEVCECSACGASFIVPHEYERIAPDEDELWPKFNYCPNCGRKVVDE